jgi:prepilin-type N-terminal cleavage/methylation domain-containing protein
MPSSSRPRSGFTLVEMLIALVLLSSLGGVMAGFILANNRFVRTQDALRDARAVSRRELDRLTADLRAVEATGGVVAAAPTDLTIRVPYALGVVCHASGAQTVVSLLPPDSLLYANAGFSGYAWRGNLGVYTYQDGGTTLGTSTASACAPDSVSTLPGGRVITLSPGAPFGTPTGSPVFLFQRIRYRFSPSGAMPGRIGLWRTVVATATAEELAAPFDSTAAFRFFQLGSDTSQAAAPSPLSMTRGIELRLAGASRNTPYGAPGPKVVSLTTAIFFQNRLD